MLVSKIFDFHAAHQLTEYHGDCERLHGHTYKVIVTIDHPVQEDGLALDFAVLEKLVWEKAVGLLDHSFLNDHMKNPSAENIVVWLWQKLAGALPVTLHEIVLYETPTSFVTYRGA